MPRQGLPGGARRRCQSWDARSARICGQTAWRWLKPLMIPLEQILAARSVVAEAAVRTPLVRLNVEGTPATIWLKLENLQPIGSFKLRGAYNAMRALPRDRIERGVVTASAGNAA